jgi:hypothetical protein
VKPTPFCHAATANAGRLISTNSHPNPSGVAYDSSSDRPAVPPVTAPQVWMK